MKDGVLPEAVASPAASPGADPRTNRRVSWVVTVVGGVAFVVLAAVVVPWHWLPGQSVHTVPADSVFTQAQLSRAEHLSWMLRLGGWGNLALSLAIAGW